MILILLGLMLVSNGMGDPVLERLYGVRGGNRVTVCVRGERACDGAIWLQRWVVVRERCVRADLAAPISVWREHVNCSQEIEKKTISQPHHVVARYFQSLHPTDDVALLYLDWPFFVTDSLDNQSLNTDLINKLVVWVGNINEHATSSTTAKTQQVIYYNRRYMDMHASPIKMFLATVVLPSTTFMLFFLFVIFCTGKSKSSKVPYKNLWDRPEISDTTHV